MCQLRRGGGKTGSGLDGRRDEHPEPVRLHPPTLRSECFDCSTAARRLSTGRTHDVTRGGATCHVVPAPPLTPAPRGWYHPPASPARQGDKTRMAPDPSTPVVDVTFIGAGPSGLFGAFYAGLRELLVPASSTCCPWPAANSRPSTRTRRSTTSPAIRPSWPRTWSPTCFGRRRSGTRRCCSANAPRR